MKNKKMLLSALISMVLAFSVVLPAAAGSSSTFVSGPDDCTIARLKTDCSSLALAMSLNTLQDQATPMVAAGEGHTVGLRSDGTVVALGDNDYGQCNVGDWRDIIRVAAGYAHTIGLKSGGSIVAVGNNAYGQCNLGGWKDIIGAAAGGSHTVGLKSDGTVVAMGDDSHGQCDVGGWTDMAGVAAG